MSKQSVKTIGKKPRVTVIIPVYNCEQYIRRCIDSVLNQTFQNFEIIAVNDGSTDGSLSILTEISESNESKLTVIDQKNHGQGYTRNRQLEKSNSEYILFLDADDYIEPLTLELAVSRADNDNADFVHFDWKLISDNPDKPDAFVYRNTEPFAHKDKLTNAECDEMLGANTFYSVANLYRRSFLLNNDISYDEGYIYEDVIFLVRAVTCAKLISLIQSPLYNVQRNPTSTTRSGLRTDRHYKHFLRAVEKSFTVLSNRNPYASFYLAGYLLASFTAYYYKRVPLGLRGAFAKGFVDNLSYIKFVHPPNAERWRLLVVMIRYGIFEDKKYALFRAMVNYKKLVIPRGKRAIGYARRAKTLLVNYQHSAYLLSTKRPLVKGSIIFLGFDGRYTGNSRYLFEELIADERFSGNTIKFLSDDDLIPKRNRLAPDGEKYYEWLARGEIIIAESWVPGTIKKREGSKWIQLWHGLPLKKMMFDSPETEAIKKNERLKIAKYANILNWDYLLVDSQISADKFSSAFLFPKDKMIYAGYPRVKYLLDNVSNTKLKQDIKKKLGFSIRLMAKRIVLYAPTWRDYNNSSNKDKNFEYLLDLELLCKLLGDEYVVLFNDHHFMPSDKGAQPSNVISTDSYETQELLLIADYLVTDYSSIMFDAFAIGLPTALYTNDLSKYEEVRGVYPEMWADLSALANDSVRGIADQICSKKTVKNYSKITKKYSYDRRQDLAGFIDTLVNLKQKDHR